MATRIPLYSPNPAYFAEDGAPQFNSPALFTLVTGTDYLIDLTKGPILLWVIVELVLPAVLIITSGVDPFGRRADVTVNIQNSSQTNAARFFTEDVWADANGDLAFKFIGLSEVNMVPIRLISDGN